MIMLVGDDGDEDYDENDGQGNVDSRLAERVGSEERSFLRWQLLGTGSTRHGHLLSYQIAT